MWNLYYNFYDKSKFYDGVYLMELFKQWGCWIKSTNHRNVPCTHCYL